MGMNPPKDVEAKVLATATKVTAVRPPLDQDRISRILGSTTVPFVPPAHEFTVSLPYPPTVNTYWRHVGSKVLISAKGRQYRKDVAAVVGFCKTFVGPLKVDVLASVPDKRRRDIDNIAKALLDAMKHAGVYGDDSQIHDLRLRWGETMPPDGEVVVNIQTLEGP